MSGKLDWESGKLDFSRQFQPAMRAAQRIKDLEGRVRPQQASDGKANESRSIRWTRTRGSPEIYRGPVQELLNSVPGTEAARVSTGIRNHLVMITFMPAVTGMP